MNRLCILLLTFFMASTVFAGGEPVKPADDDRTKETTEKAEITYYLDEIVTTASRIPQLLKYTPGSVSVITEEMIKKKKPQDVGDVLEDVAGLKVERYGSLGSTTTIHIRGLYSSHVLVMVDGRPINSPSLGIADLSLLSLDNIEKIEVVRGPNSALYGSSAVAGVVNIITKNPPEERTTNASVSYGTWNTLMTSMESGATLNDLGFLISGSYKTSDGNRDHSDHKSGDFNIKTSYEFNEETRLTVSSGHFYGETEVPGVKPAPDISNRNNSQIMLGNNDVSSLFDYNRNRHSYINADFESGDLQLDAYLNYWNDDSHMEWIQSGSRMIQDDKLKTTVYGGELQYSMEIIEQHALTGGVSLKEETFDVDSNMLDSSTAIITKSQREPSRTTWAFFAEDEITIEPVRVVLGVRHDDPDNFKAQTSFKANVLWTVGENTNLRVSYGDSFKAPTLNDLYWPESSFDLGNPNLTPEKGDTYELGIEQTFGDKILVRTSVFRQELEDMIVWAPTGPPDPFGGNKWQPDNLNKAVIKGIEVESRVAIVKGFDFLLSYTYLDGEQKNKELVDAVTNALEERTRTIAYLPRHKLDLGVSYEDLLSVSGLNLHLNAQYVSETYQYYQNWDAPPVVSMDTKKMDSYWLADTKVTKKIKNMEIFFAVNNIFDEEYAIQFGQTIDDRDYPMPGRSITGGITVRM